MEIRMAKNLLAITVAGQLRWLKEAISTLRDPLDVLVIDDATPGDEIRDFCKREGIEFLTKPEPKGLTDSWNRAYKYFKEHNYDNCIISNDDVRFPQGFSEGLFEGLKEFDLIAPLSNEPGIVWDVVHSPAHQEIRRYVDININERDIDRVQNILIKRYRKARQANFVNGFCFAFSRSISKFAYDEKLASINAVQPDVQFLFNPAHINTWNEYDLAERISRKGGKIGICKTSYIFHWKGKTTEKLDRNGVSSGDYREQLWR